MSHDFNGSPVRTPSNVKTTTIYTGTTHDISNQLLKEILAELQTLNSVLGCKNALAIPHILSEIKENTKKPVPVPVRKAKKATK